jgi:hypothetical protein
MNCSNPRGKRTGFLCVDFGTNIMESILLLAQPGTILLSRRVLFLDRKEASPPVAELPCSEVDFSMLYVPFIMYPDIAGKH